MNQTDVIRHTLPNGLLILLKEIHTAPLISHWVWYRVGLRNEPPGQTGLSHWVEHMQFKGTPTFPAGVLDKAIAREGGTWNAFTYLDWTTYFETLPAEKIELAIRLEADRMGNSLFDPAEVEAERTVILSERQGHENDPLFRLSEQVTLAAFTRHPYRYEIIGLTEDLQRIGREDLYRHYRHYYTPDHAVLAVAGSFDSAEMLRRLEEAFGALPAGQQPALSPPPEAPIPTAQEIVVTGPGDTVYLQIVYPAPAAHQADFFPLMVLDSLLTGPSNLNMFTGGISNKTSRLYRALVERELAISVYGELHATLDPYLYTITAIVHPSSSPQQVRQVIDEEISRLQETAPEPEELRVAVKQARALFAYGSESITNQAFWLGYSEMFADYSWFKNYLTGLMQVTPAQVQELAQRFFRPEQRLIGIYQPIEGRSE